MAKIQEVNRLDQKIFELEKAHANQIEELYSKIAMQEHKYKQKIDEIAQLKQVNSELLIS